MAPPAVIWVGFRKPDVSPEPRGKGDASFLPGDSQMRVTITALAVALTACTASARPTIEFLPPGYLLSDLSLYGEVGVGNVVDDGSFESFRWTSADGVQRLGRATLPVIGVAAAAPKVSHYGARISASILSSDNQQTWGVWDSINGWIEAMPPPPADGVIQDQRYGSAWGISGDGMTLTGLYQSNWSGPTRARPGTWSLSTGMVALPSNNGVNCRVNASNYDGTIVAGWEDHGGPWWPTVWRNGVKTNIHDGDGGGGGQVFDVSADGSILVGSEYQESISTRSGTIWTWDGSAYVMQNTGTLPGTLEGFGQAYFSSMADDGSMAVGSNIYTQSPGAARDGIVWTPADGLMRAADYIVALGLAAHFTASMEIREMSAVSPDGSVITGIVLETAGGSFQSFVIRLTPPPCFGDADGSQVVDFSDILSVLANFGATGDPFIAGDANGSGVVDFNDVLAVLANFGASCGLPS